MFLRCDLLSAGGERSPGAWRGSAWSAAARKAVATRSFSAMLIRNFDRPVVVRIGPTIIRDQRGPARPAGILIVRIAPQALVKFAVFAQLFTIEFDAQAGSARHFDRTILVLHQTTLDDVVCEMVIVSVRSEGEVRQDGTEMQHGGQLNSEFAGGVDCNAELKRFANGGSFHAGSNAAPERSVEQNDIDGGVERVGGELLEVDDDGVCGQGNPDHLARSTHAVQAEDGIFQVVVV